MQVGEILTVAAIGAFISQIASRTAGRYWRRSRRARRQDALRHLDEITRRIPTVQSPSQAASTRWRAAPYQRYFVPAGLHLEQARRILRERRSNLGEDKSAVTC
jgi:hypothetical protein